MRIVLATANPGKAGELRAVLGAAAADAELLERPHDVPDVEELGATLEDNARLKAAALCGATGLPALADDTGLEVDALEGAPGVRSARYAGERATDAENRAALLRALQGVPPARRGARFATVVVLALPDGRELVGRGEVAGVIAERARGGGGFGYDPLFVPAEGDGRTFAEMPAEEKHAVSHRGRALRAVVARMRDAGLVA